MERRTKLGGCAALLGVAVLLSGGFDAKALATTCHSRSDCGSPIKGGLRISSAGWACTTGFVARTAATGQMVVVTAGHCVVGSGLLARWSNGRTVIGRAALEALHEGSSADVGALVIAESDASNLVYARSNTDLMSVMGWAANTSQAVGSVVCRSGGFSGWHCGSIVSADVDTTLEGTLIHHTWWTDFPSLNGDSGSPMVDLDGRALGIVIATTSTQTVYSTVDGIATELGVRLCTDPDCT